MSRFFSRIAAAGAVCALIACATPAFGQAFAGDTTGDPTFNRPTSLVALSGVGTNVEYEVTPFFVTTAGNYTFTSISLNQTPLFYDGYLLLYNNGFTPGTPLVNLLAGDDDFDPDGGGPIPATGGSRITTSGGNSFGTPGPLSTGVQYFLVQTGFNNDDQGPYTGTIDGPAPVSFGLIPEPASLSLAGLGGLALLRRRR